MGHQGEVPVVASCAGAADIRDPEQPKRSAAHPIGALSTRYARRLTDHAGGAVQRGLCVLTAGVMTSLISLGVSQLSYRAASGRAAVETGTAIIALGGAWMSRSQFSYSRRLSDLLFVGAFVTIGITNLSAGALPSLFGVDTEQRFAAANLLSEVIVACLLTGAAFAPAKRLVRGLSRPLWITAVLSASAGTMAGLGNIVLHAHRAVGTAVGPTAAVVWPQAAGVLAVTSAGLLVFASARFLTPASGRSGHAGMAVGAVLLAAASLEQALPGALGNGASGPSELLGFAAITSLAVTAARREFAMRSRVVRAAALAERRRIACDLHDGLAQDLAFIAAFGARLIEDLGEEHPLVLAARRALSISQCKISELSDPAGATVHESIDAVAQELRDRFHIAVAVDVQLDNDLPSEMREHVARIAREAIANAARHGGARNVIVELKPARSGTALRVVDDGCGIRGRTRDAGGAGFGLRSMRDRTAGLGGHLDVRETTTGGTEIEAVFP